MESDKKGAWPTRFSDTILRAFQVVSYDLLPLTKKYYHCIVSVVSTNNMVRFMVKQTVRDGIVPERYPHEISQPEKIPAIQTIPPVLNRLMTIKEVCEFMGLSRVTIWRMVKDGKFPKPIKISARKRVWPVTDVVAYLQRLEADRAA